MASRFFAQLAQRRVLASGAALGGAGLATTTYFDTQKNKLEATEAKIQFETSSIHPCPKEFTPWQIRNDYPTTETMEAQLRAKASASTSAPGMPSLPPPGLPGDFEGENAPWFKFDFEKDPEDYAEAIRRYCFEGNVQAGFKLQENKIRDWYHAPWMHYRDPNSTCTEREPINGFTFERATPAYEFAQTQDKALQNWACGFFNATGATVLGDMWKDLDNPDYTKDKRFPVGTCVFKILLNDAKDHQLPMYGSPVMNAVISKSTKNGKERNDFASPLRLIQVDFAVVEPRSPIGWVFGTFMYDQELASKDPWEKLTLVGLQWGNDPWLTQAVHDQDPSKPAKPRESYISKRANDIRLALNGSRPSWGWNGRMNGPADNFISACASCHSTSSRDPMLDAKGRVYSIVPPTNPKTRQPNPGYTDADVMVYFRNVPGGVPFDEGLAEPPSSSTGVKPSLTKSGDYSLQLQVGWSNYKKWKQTNESILRSVVQRGKRYVVGQTDPADISQRDHLRQGPDVEYEKKEE